MRARLVRSLLLMAICAWTAGASEDAVKQPAPDAKQPAPAPEVDGGDPEAAAAAAAGALSLSCDTAESATSRTLLDWKAVPAKADADAGGGEDGGSRLELTLDEETLRMLSEIDTKIAVASISGPYRTGKSYFLNYLANHALARGSEPPRSPGSFTFERPFLTSPAVNVDDSDDIRGRVSCHLLPACAKPLPDQPDTALLLLDTPGLMAPRRPAAMEGQVMTLLEAVSSVVLFNTQAVVSRLDVEALTMSIDAATALDTLLLLETEHDTQPVDKADPDGGDGGASQPSLPSLPDRPKLVWLLQKSTSEVVNGKGEAVEPAAYLEGMLGDLGRGKARGTFDRFFVARDAARLPFPVNDVEKLQDLDSVPYAGLSDAYRESVGRALGVIAKACAPKEVGGEAVQGPSLVALLRNLAQALNVDGTDPLPATATFLDSLEAKELGVAKAACRADWERFELPASADALMAEQQESLKRAILAASPRSTAPGQEGQEGEGGGEREPASRRREFIHKLTLATEEVYEEYCGYGATLWMQKEQKDFEEELSSLPGQPLPEEQDVGFDGQHEDKDSAGTAAQGEDESLLPPHVDKVRKAHESRVTRWREEVAPGIVRSHPAVGHAAAEHGGLSEKHMAGLDGILEIFLKASAKTATLKARHFFDGAMEDLKASLLRLPQPVPLEGAKRLASEAESAALAAMLMVRSAVGPDAAADAVEEEGWEGEAAAAGKEWVWEAEKVLGDDPDKKVDGDGGGGGGGGGEDGNGNPKGDAADAGDVPKEDGDGKDGSGDRGGGGGGDDGVSELVESILKDLYAPCVAKVTLRGKGGEDTLKNCRAAVDKEWGKREEAKPELKGKKADSLDPAVDAKEAECIDRAIEDDFEKTIRTKFLEESSKLQMPAPEASVDRLEKGAMKKLVGSMPKGFLLGRKTVWAKLRGRLDRLVSDFRSTNAKAWKSACLTAADTYKLEVSRATSFFSLAPLRFSSDGPPFHPERCLNTGAAAEKVRRTYANQKQVYQRRTWARRWLVWLALRVGFVFFVTAATLLGAGRQLQHKPVATAFLAAAGFQFVVLCLSVSEGLRLGTRLWLLVSTAVLFYTASGSTAGGKGKRGRRPRRAIWSTAGGKVVRSGGSVIPLFWGGAGAGAAGGGKNGGGGGGRAGGSGGPGGWGGRGARGHKE